MVEYTDWTKAVHTRFRQMGGDYEGNQEIVKAITKAAARWWQENKERIKRFTFEQAVDFAGKVIEELVGAGVLDAR